MSYSYLNSAFNNLGAGVGLRLGNVHLHLVTDNLLAFAMLDKVRNANFRFGLGFSFGCNKREKGRRTRGPGCYWLKDIYE